ncbi:unnamed protein product, partial [Macrosiphum euphorbiae]
RDRFAAGLFAATSSPPSFRRHSFRRDRFAAVHFAAALFAAVHFAAVLFAAVSPPELFSDITSPSLALPFKLLIEVSTKAIIVPLI